jgi:hypothetical protein
LTCFSPAASPRSASAQSRPVRSPTSGVSAAAVLWLSLWLFNGCCTVAAWVGFNTWLAIHLYWMDSPIWRSLWLQIPSGIVVHLLVSAIEQHLWRSASPPTPGLDVVARCQAMLRSVRTWESVLVGSLDSFTTSRTLVALTMLFGFGNNLPTIIWCTLLGTALALGTEPMLRYHGITLKSFVRR